MQAINNFFGFLQNIEINQIVDIIIALIIVIVGLLISPFISYGVLRIFYKKASFFWKKVSVCSIYMICATVYAFEHCGFIFLSVIYTVIYKSYKSAHINLLYKRIG